MSHLPETATCPEHGEVPTKHTVYTTHGFICGKCWADDGLLIRVKVKK